MAVVCAIAAMVPPGVEHMFRDFMERCNPWTVEMVAMNGNPKRYLGVSAGKRMRKVYPEEARVLRVVEP